MGCINFTASPSFTDCSIRVYKSFAATCCRCRNIGINELFPIMLPLCQMLSSDPLCSKYAGFIPNYQKNLTLIQKLF